MFRSLKRTVSKKKENYQKESVLTEAIENSVKDFLNSNHELKPFVGMINFNYNPKDCHLYLKSKNKTIANEVLFISPKLISFLKEKGTKVTKIVVS